MKKHLFIQFNAIIENNNSLEELKFMPGVIGNLIRVNKQLGYELNFVVEEKHKNNNVFVKAFEILQREGLLFEWVGSENNSASDLIIAKTENGLTILSQNSIGNNYDTWNDIFNYLKSTLRKILHARRTNETDIRVELNIDGTGMYKISTGLGFFDHMLEQFSKHSSIDIELNVTGDLHIDEHHTIEDTAIALGETILKALGDKRGMERYGFLLPMDDCLAQVAIDFVGRSWLVWEVAFNREYVGDVPTEMFYHFFKSFSDAVKCNLNIKAEGANEHHKIEAIFKAFAKAIKMAATVNYDNAQLPTTKGIL
jgi:imidazoleglycerol-phosphate dehydratase/histidinol-phosphatase